MISRVVETRWLTPDESRTWCAFLRATRLLLDHLDRELQRAAAMPHAYYVILAALSQAPDRAARMSELAEATSSSRSRLSHAVARMEAQGWVRRVRCVTDKRGQVAVLTEAGCGALAAAAPCHVDGVRRHLFQHLTPAQVRQLRTISEAIATHLTAAPAAAEAAHAIEISEFRLCHAVPAAHQREAPPEGDPGSV
jgi:DNA-binding MarR family transcriptional regulator